MRVYLKSGNMQQNQVVSRKWNPLSRTSLYFKVAVILFFVFTVTMLASTYQLERNMEMHHIDLIKNHLKSLASTAAFSIDGDIVESWQREEQQQTAPYIQIKKALLNLKESSNAIQDIYIMRKGAADRALVFLMDIDDSEDAAGFNELYDSSGAPELLNGFDRPTADGDFITDKWGRTLSGYAPIKNRNGETVAVVGIDFNAESIQGGIEQARKRIFLYSAMSMVFMLLISLLLAKSIVGRLNRVKLAVDTALDGEGSTCRNYQDKDEVNLLAFRVNNLIQKVTVEKEQILISIIMTLVNTLEVRDEYTHGHSTEVAVMATDIMNTLQVDHDEKFTINFAALLHDIGKIGICDTILQKTDKLTEEEFAIIREHPVIGAKILEGIPSLKQISEIVKQHHERYDGRGYPDKLAGEKISFGARIIAVADSFQAMISDRPYRKGMPQAVAMEELVRNKGTQFDPVIVEAFLEICKTKQYKIQQ